MVTSTFSALKKNRANSLDNLTAKLDQLSKGRTFEEDTRFWQPAVDKNGNGYAVIRFLPASPIDIEKKGEDVLPFVIIWDHGFQGPGGGWYIEKSLTTLGLADPVSEHNSFLWNRNKPGDREFVQGVQTGSEKRAGSKRRTYYYANILVVKDPAKPENEGKVFLYKFGKKIFDKINAASNPPVAGMPKIDPFSFWDGANFQLVICKKQGYRNYDDSKFEVPTAAVVTKGKADDAAMEAIHNLEYSLQELVDPSKFKTYAELKTRLERTLGGMAPTASKSVEDEEVVTSKPAAGETPPWEEEEAAPTVAGDDDDEIAEFQALVNK